MAKYKITGLIEEETEKKQKRRTKFFACPIREPCCKFSAANEMHKQLQTLTADCYRPLDLRGSTTMTTNKTASL